MSTNEQRRPVVLLTGAGRTAGIAAAIGARLADQGWDVAMTYWSAYDQRMPWGRGDAQVEAVQALLQEHGARVVAVEADLADPGSVEPLFERVQHELGPVRALVLSHCESVNSDLLTTTVESFDRHMAVNARATWLLVAEFARRFAGPFGTGRIVALTSDHTVGNLPYGASKGAMDRIVLTAARELADLGVSANVVNPGATDTGWMSEQLLAFAAEQSPLCRVGTPSDAASLVAFLCSPDGQWINGQLICSDGGIHS